MNSGCCCRKHNNHCYSDFCAWCIWCCSVLPEIWKDYDEGPDHDHICSLPLACRPHIRSLWAKRADDSRVGLIIVYLSISVPYAIWLLVGFFQTVPLEIEEAAYMDGANKLQVFSRVVLPIVAPGVVAVAIYTFINVWNEFLFSLILINSRDKMTVAVGLKSLMGQEVLDWGVMMAASALVVIPSVIFFMLIQKRIAGGLAQGSIK